MAQLSLGLIETVGLAAAIEAADAAVKSANVALVGYELTKGDGMAVVKVEGEVGAVNAAIAAAAAAAAKVGRGVYATRVIPRPASGLSPLVANASTVGVQRAAPPGPAVVDAPEVVEPVAPAEVTPVQPEQASPQPEPKTAAASPPPTPASPPARPVKGGGRPGGGGPGKPRKPV